MMLPFLNHNKWPVSKEPDEKIVNQSSEGQLQDHLLDNIMVALEQKNHSKLKEDLIALIHSLLQEE